MPLDVQVSLLRVLQTREVVRIGAKFPKPVSVRVIAATNRNLLEAVESKTFREDLYYRLNTIPVEIPPLRQRKEEILPICEVILGRVIQKYGLAKRYFSEEAIESLMSYRWPGNIRELISVVERAVILSDSEAISKEDLFLESRSWFSA